MSEELRRIVERLRVLYLHHQRMYDSRKTATDTGHAYNLGLADGVLEVIGLIERQKL